MAALRRERRMFLMALDVNCLCAIYLRAIWPRKVEFLPEKK
jgi:hypothetical protein